MSFCGTIRFNDFRSTENFNDMKGTFSAILVLGIISLSGFEKDTTNYEQLTFDYFVSDILTSDFNNVTTFKFKGQTEDSYSTFGKYKFCLKPEEKLGSLIEDLTKKRSRSKKVKEINYGHVKGLTIVDFKSKENASWLFVYPSLHVADHYYVFVVFQKPKEQSVKYVFELTPEGDISRSCKI
jgi:hypothetical protein